MSAEIVNLNKARKQKKRAAEDRQAHTNRMRFGRSTAERSSDDAARAKLTRTVDGAKRDHGSASEQSAISAVDERDFSGIDHHDIEVSLPPRLDDDHDDLDPGAVS